MSIKKEFAEKILLLGHKMKNPKWQGITGVPDFVEIYNQTLEIRMPDTKDGAEQVAEPDLPWADHHFAERISGNPTNPGEAYKTWPFYKHDEKFRDQDGGKFTHTYQERIWPKMAGNATITNYGIRYELGDLNNLIDLMINNPHTRQAFLPIWFPEDTGATHGGRLPCTLGYLFWIRPMFGQDEFHVNYYIRSCDLVRHFHNDVYFAIRIGHHVRAKVSEAIGKTIPMGILTMHIANLHCFETDLYHLRKLTR